MTEAGCLKKENLGGALECTAQPSSVFVGTEGACSLEFRVMLGPSLVCFHPSNAAIPPGSDNARLPQAQHYFTCWVFLGQHQDLVACRRVVHWPGPRASSPRGLFWAPRFSSPLGRYFWGSLGEISRFPRQVSAKHGLLLFLLFLALLAHSLFSKITMWKKQQHPAKLLQYTVCRLCYIICILLCTLEWFVNSVL